MPRSNERSPNQAQRTVGLDKACRVCGQTIYYNYQGPIDGLCGRCADRSLTKHRRPGKTKKVYVEGQGQPAKTGLLFFFGVLAGAAAMYIAYPYLPF